MLLLHAVIFHLKNLIENVSALVKCVKSVPAYFAERLYKSMKVRTIILYLLPISYHITVKHDSIMTLQQSK